MHSNITYNPLQKETFAHVGHSCNLIVCAPTSSGKTIVAEQFMLPLLQEGKKVLYLSPLKALTQEKLDDWSDLGCSIVAITSDHMKKPRPIWEQLILMTTEALDSRSRGMTQWLGNITLVVCDEAHLLRVAGRGDAFEVGLTRFTKLNPNARIIFLSATIPNPQDLAGWLKELNGRETHVVQTDWRPVKLTTHIIPLPDANYEFNRLVLQQIARLRAKHRDESILVFVHTFMKGYMISTQFGIPFHNSRLSKDERNKIEKAFRERKLRMLVATSTLAMGVNLPADIGVIVGTTRGPIEVPGYELEQMVGRIGRYGLSSGGTAYILVQEFDKERVERELNDPTPVESVLPARLYFHLCSFISREGMAKEDVIKFVGRSFYGYMKGDVKVEVETALDILRGYNILTNSYGSTSLSRASALMYVDPIDLRVLRDNLRSKPLDPEGIAVAFASLPSNEIPTYVPDIPDLLELEYGHQTLIATAIKYWIEGKDIPTELHPLFRVWHADVERWLSALAIAGIDKGYLKKLSLLLEKGVGEELCELVEIPGVGRARATRMFRQGIRSKEDFLDDHNQGYLIKLMGRKAYMRAVASLLGKIYVG